MEALIRDPRSAECRSSDTWPERVSPACCRSRPQWCLSRGVRHAGDVQDRIAGFVERRLELIAAELVNAVERRILRCGGDLGTGCR